MAECLCESCRPDLHPAARDAPAFRYSLVWMRECLARQIAGLPRADREAHYQAVAVRSGPDAAGALVDAVKAAHKAKQEGLF